MSAKLRLISLKSSPVIRLDRMHNMQCRTYLESKLHTLMMESLFTRLRAVIHKRKRTKKKIRNRPRS